MQSSDRNAEHVVSTYQQQLAVPFSYPVHFAKDVFAATNPLLADTLDRLGERRRHRAAVYVDSGVAEAHPRLIAQIQEYFHDRPDKIELAASPTIIPGGRAAKTGWNHVREIMWTLGNLHLDRQSFVIAIGGGGVLDMVGFGTSIVHRGLRLVRLPSTVLAQNDAGVGVKNGMDEHGMKNFVGTFAPPFAVINDFTFLPTLRPLDWLGGVAEAFKVAIIKDRDFFDFLCAHAVEIRNRDLPVMEHVVRRAAELHLQHIAAGGDPFEFGSARPLDFGHWAGHKLESMSNFAMGHGEAVAYGIAMDTVYAARLGMLTAQVCERVIAALAACGLGVSTPLSAQRDAAGELTVLGGLEDFREHLGGVLTVTLPAGLGSRQDVHHMNPDTVAAAIEYLRTR